MSDTPLTDCGRALYAALKAERDVCDSEIAMLRLEKKQAIVAIKTALKEAELLRACLETIIPAHGIDTTIHQRIQKTLDELEATE